MAACVLVLGVPRSGTSCVAGILHHLGVWMGDRHFPICEQWNAKGFFADEMLNEMHWEMIRHKDSEASHVHPVPVEAVTEVYQAEIARRQSLGVPWGFKLTETSCFLRHLQGMLPDLRVIRTTRRFASSVRSWEARNHGPLDTIHDAILRIAEYMFAIDEALERTGITPLVVQYERLVANPETEVGRIAEFAGVPLNDAAVAFVVVGMKRF